MIHFLVGLRLVLVVLLLIAFAVAVISYFGLLMVGKARRRAAIGFASPFVVGILLLLLNLLISFCIYNQIRSEVNMAAENSFGFTVNDTVSVLSIEELQAIVNAADFYHLRNHTRNEKEYRVKIFQGVDTVDFSLFRDSGNRERYWMYTNDYRYELKLISVKTNLLDGL